MELKKENLSNEVLALYEEIISNLTSNTLEIVMEKPSFTNGIASYTCDEEGNYKIYITPGFCTDYILSHELLHVYSVVCEQAPVLTSFETNVQDLSKYIAITLNDTIQHSWIVSEQRRRNIPGEEEFVNTSINNLINQDYSESGKASEDFYMINAIYGIISNHTKYINKVEETIGEKYPCSLKYAKELLEERVKYDLTSPFYARRYVIKSINKYIEWFGKDDVNLDFLKREIIVKPVFTERQKERRADAALGIDKSDEIYCLYTVVDFQKCSANFSANIQSLRQGELMLSAKKLGQLLDETGLPYYVDYGNGKWRECSRY